MGEKIKAPIGVGALNHSYRMTSTSTYHFMRILNFLQGIFAYDTKKNLRIHKI